MSSALLEAAIYMINRIINCPCLVAGIINHSNKYGWAKTIIQQSRNKCIHISKYGEFQIILLRGR